MIMRDYVFFKPVQHKDSKKFFMKQQFAVGVKNCENVYSVEGILNVLIKISDQFLVDEIRIIRRELKFLLAFDLRSPN